jgi:diguanylate cyclase (GGDEF)-like protein
MKGHNIGGLPVLEDDQVVGILDYLDILGKDGDIPVGNVMDREFIPIPPDMPVGDAADLMTKMGASRLLVMENGTLVGIVTRSDLLPEIGKSVDPITGLARADAMRDWGIAALRRGQEISVLFIDLDQFGQFNKKYGHITGDRVLKHVAQILQSSVEEGRDMLCRYAGDEFVIVTTRNSQEAKELAEKIAEKLKTTENPELPEAVTGSIGIYGGKRTREREQVHYEATLDNLINLASKSCTLAKGQGTMIAQPNGTIHSAVKPAETNVKTAETKTETPAEVQPAPQPGPVVSKSKRLKILSLGLSWGAGSTATAHVELSNGIVTRNHSRSGFAIGQNALRLVVDAAAEAVTQFLPSSDYGVVAESVNVVPSGSGDDIVVVTALVFSPQNQIKVCGSALVKQDVYRSAVAALLDAVNRQISELI